MNEDSKYQEALNRLNQDERYQIGNEKIILQELVDKATPKNVRTFEYQDELYFVCSRCGLVEMIREIKFMNYCPNCGQAIDWSKNE